MGDGDGGEGGGGTIFIVIGDTGLVFSSFLPRDWPSNGEGDWGGVVSNEEPLDGGVFLRRIGVGTSLFL